ncbi:MAG: hypothetical protein HQM04_08450 [Magnetococcales bacterium]|nr:hypothetical protein [Magnetococcales bacterium]MBF0115062.1 hypothetical protein [Magnetococcales bacterium]
MHKHILLIVLAILCCSSTVRSEEEYCQQKIDELFVAGQRCPAYASIRNGKMVNPDDLVLEAGRKYGAHELLSLDRDFDPQEQWVYVHVPERYPTQYRNRWVRRMCGSLQKFPYDNNGQKTGRWDKFVLSLSWLPGQCMKYSEYKRPECIYSIPLDYSATNFVFQEFRPEDSDNKAYNFCGTQKDNLEKYSKCKFPEVACVSCGFDKFNDVIPSIYWKSCMERSAWYKHGTCTFWTPEQYFTIAANLVRQFNKSGISGFMQKNIGTEIDSNSLMNEIKNHYGEEAGQHISLQCEKIDEELLLIGLEIYLPGHIEIGDNLKELIEEAPNKPKKETHCKGKIKISAF